MLYNQWHKKEKPLPTLIGMSGGATSLVLASGSTLCTGVHSTPSGAQHFWDWSYSHEDQVGSVDFTANTSAITLNDNTSEYGGPPGWGCTGTGRYAERAAGTGTDSGALTYRTALGSIPNYAESAWTFDICLYVNMDPSDSTNGKFMPWTTNTPGQIYGLQHYWNGNMLADTAKSDFTGRVGEAAEGTGPLPTENKWNVLRMSFSGSTFSTETWSDDGSDGWTQNGSTDTFSKTSGTQPGPNGVGSIYLNGFGALGANSYGKDNIYYAWAAFYHSDKSGSSTAPYIPS